jgi:hypothetical protein
MSNGILSLPIAHSAQETQLNSFHKNVAQKSSPQPAVVIDVHLLPN